MRRENIPHKAGSKCHGSNMRITSPCSKKKEPKWLQPGREQKCDQAVISRSLIMQSLAGHGQDFMSVMGSQRAGECCELIYIFKRSFWLPYTELTVEGQEQKQKHKSEGYCIILNKRWCSSLDLKVAEKLKVGFGVYFANVPELEYMKKKSQRKF